MRKLLSKSGVTIMEMLVGLVIMVFLIIGIGVGMDTGNRVYKESTFEADSASLAGILNTALGDILRHCEDIRITSDESLQNAGIGFVFTNYDYGVRDAYFDLPIVDDIRVPGILQMKNLRDDRQIDIVNAGAYPNLVISDFDLIYVAPGNNSQGDPGRGGYFNLQYTIQSLTDDTLKRDVESVIRTMNTELVEPQETASE